MTGLETAYYIIGIVFMGLMLILLATLVVAVLVIRAKVNKIHRLVEERINSFTSVFERGGEIAGAVLKTGKKILSK